MPWAIADTDVTAAQLLYAQVWVSQQRLAAHCLYPERQRTPEENLSELWKVAAGHCQWLWSLVMARGRGLHWCPGFFSLPWSASSNAGMQYWSAMPAAASADVQQGQTTLLGSAASQGSGQRCLWSWRPGPAAGLLATRQFRGWEEDGGNE